MFFSAGYRVDNARLFPSIPWQGLCGSELPRQATYTSSQNYITIQFAANAVSDYMTGFSLHLRQYPRRNSGTELSQTGYIGGNEQKWQHFLKFETILKHR